MSHEPLLVDRLDASSKRKREEERYSVDLGRPRGAHHCEPLLQSDCFEQAFAGHLVNSDYTVRSSWLQEEHSWRHASVLHLAKKHYGVVSLKEQIKAIQHQLSLLKRRFGPAAEQCAMTYNTTATLEFQEARKMCNPFEGLDEGFLHTMFLNRAGIKLANMDALLGFSLTHCHSGRDFTFVDLCGAPGGFSEYLLKRCPSPCHGYGMSLRGTNEHGRGVSWKLHHILNNTDGTFKTCYGRDGTGDVYRWENIEALQREITSDTSFVEGKVHLVVADGGFDAQRDAECQEEVAQKLIVCQASAALTLLRKDGTLVMKMFGFQTSTTRTLVKALFQAFDKMTVVKPISSRPASAERYVVFAGYKGAPPHFDGHKWQHDIFLGQNTGGDEDHPELETNLLYCLDECDRDILHLNQKACFEILSYMERKTQAHSQDWSVYKPHVNIEAYKREWRLD